MSAADYRARIERLNPGLNAFVDLASNASGTGLAWGVKSNIAVKGLPLTAGCEAYRRRVADQDAPIIDRIRRSGGGVLGTVNMHGFKAAFDRGGSHIINHHGPDAALSTN